MFIVKSYQSLAVAGGVIGILIAFVMILTVGVLGAINDAFGGSPLEDKEQFELTMVASIILYIAAIVLPFTLKNTKIVGGALLGIGTITLIMISLYGVIGFALLIAAGIVAIRKQKPVSEIDNTRS